MVAGAPFPDIYDWTWGEVIEYINCVDERLKDDYRVDASLLFNHATLIGSMFSGKSHRKISVMDSFSFLWSKKERDEVRAERRHASLTKKAKPKQKAMTLEEQDRLLSEKKREILAKRQS